MPLTVTCATPRPREVAPPGVSASGMCCLNDKTCGLKQNLEVTVTDGTLNSQGPCSCCCHLPSRAPVRPELLLRGVPQKDPSDRGGAVAAVAHGLVTRVLHIPTDAAVIPVTGLLVSARCGPIYQERYNRQHILLQCSSHASCNRSFTRGALCPLVRLSRSSA
jgi:hypothetical protein